MPDKSAAVHVEGLNLLNRNLKRADAELPKGLKAIHGRLAEPIAAEGRSRAPSRTGRLAASVKPLSTPRAGSVSAGARLPYPYAPIVHYGGYPGEYPGQPFLVEVIEAAAPGIADEYETEIAKYLDSVWEDN